VLLVKLVVSFGVPIRTDLQRRLKLKAMTELTVNLKQVPIRTDLQRRLKL